MTTAVTLASNRRPRVPAIVHPIPVASSQPKDYVYIAVSRSRRCMLGYWIVDVHGRVDPLTSLRILC
jgi:hypothetical protein